VCGGISTGTAVTHIAWSNCRRTARYTWHHQWWRQWAVDGNWAVSV